MEGGVEKIVTLVYVIVGLVISPAIDKLVEYINIVLSYQETLNSLKAKVEDLTTIISLLQKQYPSDDIERQGSSAESAVEKWAVKLQDLHRDASAMEQNISRINVVSRYRASNEMKQKISEMEKHLKLFPLIQLELILRVLILTRRTPADILSGRPPAGNVVGSAMGHALGAHIVHEVATELINRAAQSILRRMKMVIYFNREVASLKDLVTSITPIISRIQRFNASQFPKEGAINRWRKKMSGLVEKAGKIKSLPWWNVIRRYKEAKDVADLTSTIEAHVKSASLVSLEPLFQELPRKKHRPSAQVVETFIEVDASNDERLRAPQEVEASTGEGLVMQWKPLYISN